MTGSVLHRQGRSRRPRHGPNGQCIEQSIPKRQHKPTEGRSKPQEARMTGSTKSSPIMYEIHDYPEEKTSLVLSKQSECSSALYARCQEEKIGDALQVTTSKTNKLARKVTVCCEGTPHRACLLYTSPSPRDRQKSRMPSSA